MMKNIPFACLMLFGLWAQSHADAQQAPGVLLERRVVATGQVPDGAQIDKGTGQLTWPRTRLTPAQSPEVDHLLKAQTKAIIDLINRVQQLEAKVQKLEGASK